MDFLKDPPVLFFVLGILSVFLKTGLEIPEGLSKFLSLYLLMSIGFKGGLYLAKTGIDHDFLICLAGGLILAATVPVVLYSILRRKLSVSNAAGIAATYGSVSAVTFVAATTFLENRAQSFAGSMIAILAFMEAPAIIVALALARRDSSRGPQASLGKLLHESVLNASVYLLMGSVIVGFISGPFGKESVGSLIIDLFKGLLSFFLLDLGIKSGRTITKMELPLWLVAVGIIVPVTNAMIALAWSLAWGVSPGNTFLLMALAAGASYIAVPAALKYALPQSDAGIYLTMALGVTFPFNILIGLPTYWTAIEHFKQFKL